MDRDFTQCTLGVKGPRNVKTCLRANAESLVIIYISIETKCPDETACAG